MSIERRPVPHIRLLFVLLAASAGLLFLYAVVLLFATRNGYDQSWYLYAAQQLLDGMQLYGPRLLETNPPMPIWFSVIPVALARITHLAPAQALRLVVLGMIAGSAAWSMRGLSAGFDKKRPEMVWLLGCAVVLIEFAIEFSDFGQREQLMVILSLPYLLTVSAGQVRRLSFAEYCALGIAAGMGVCFKPQEALVFVAFEIFLAIYTRSLKHALSPEFVALVLTGASYVVAVRVMTPLYLQGTVPLLLNTYWAFGEYTALSLALRPLYLVLLPVTVLIWVKWHRSLRLPAVPLALLVCSFAASVAFDLQHTGWMYQKFPSQAFLFLALLYLLIDLLEPVLRRFIAEGRSVRTTAIAAVTLMAVMVLCAFSIHKQYDINLPNEERDHLKGRTDLDALLAQYPQGTMVYIFSTGLGPFSPVFRHNLRWGSRFAHLWMLPAIVQNERGPINSSTPFRRLSPGTLDQLEALQRKDTTEDLEFWRPDLILVERCVVKNQCYAIEGKDFDTLSWFLRSPAFAAEWSHYRKISGKNDFDAYIRVP